MLQHKFQFKPFLYIKKLLCSTLNYDSNPRKYGTVNLFEFSTPLIISTVGNLLKSMPAIIAKSTTLSIDLSKISNIDSAGIAFLLDLKSIAKTKNCNLSFTNTPDIIKRFCQLYKVNL